MADVPITCPKCRKETSVSEYASPETLVCPSCGGKLELPAITPAMARRAPMLKPTEAVAPPPSALVEEPGRRSVLDLFTRARRLRRESRKERLPHVFKSWLLFFAAAGALYYLRWKSNLSLPDLDTVITAGIYATGVLQLVVIAHAFKDDFFQGTLCLFFPPYTLYYLFAISDAFYLRALVVAVLVGFGPDTAEFLIRHCDAIYFGIKNWLEHASIRD